MLNRVGVTSHDEKRVTTQKDGRVNLTISWFARVSHNCKRMARQAPTSPYPLSHDVIPTGVWSFSHPTAKKPSITRTQKVYTASTVTMTSKEYRPSTQLSQWQQPRIKQSKPNQQPLLVSLSSGMCLCLNSQTHIT